MMNFKSAGRWLCAALTLALSSCAHGVSQVAGAQSSQPSWVAPEPEAQYAQPYIDVDEWRDVPVRHRYVHGGFRGAEARFSFYLPPPDHYEGRFFQHVTPVPISETLAQSMPAGPYNKIGFAIDSGAYFVESNSGDFRANAAIAQYSRTVAQDMYNRGRAYGYIYGGSGGAYRTIGAVENTRGVWDGAAPYVVGSTMAIPNMFTVRIRALRLLWDRFPQIVDAVEPGGSGDPYAGLTELEAEALREATRMGFPTPAWFGYREMGVHGLSALYQGVVMADPTYFTDFWTKPGYLGHDHPEQFVEARLQHESTIVEAITGLQAAQLRLNTDASRETSAGGVDSAFRLPEGEAARRIVAFRLAAAPRPVRFLGGDLSVMSGSASGRSLPIARIVGDIVVLGMNDQAIVAQLRSGDRVRIDNSNFLALETYHRHQVPGGDFPVWDQFRGADGEPLYPQRPLLLGPMFVQATAGSQMTGAFEGKMIVLSSLWDREAMPWQADWYRRRVESHLGDQAEQNFRLWYTDHALHGDEILSEDPTRVVSYEGVLQQALRDLARWVEAGVAPPRSTVYQIDDGHVNVAARARERRGVQPTVALRANGAQRTEVGVGESVVFQTQIEAPPGAGAIVAAEWDFDGVGAFPISSRIREGAGRVSVSEQHAFSSPGVYFPAVRVVLQREGDGETPYGRIYNLGRVRVVVR